MLKPTIYQPKNDSFEVVIWQNEVRFEDILEFVTHGYFMQEPFELGSDWKGVIYTFKVNIYEREMKFSVGDVIIRHHTRKEYPHELQFGVDFQVMDRQHFSRIFTWGSGVEQNEMKELGT